MTRQLSTSPAKPPYRGRSPLQGFHHVTGIAGHPQENLNFYTGCLGLRLVKRSVNQDDPGTYHLFYADAVGTPGTDVTFFAMPGDLPGHSRSGPIRAVALAVPPLSLSYWMHRLARLGIPFEGPTSRFGEQVIAFHDVHGLALELVAAEGHISRPWRFWAGSPVPRDHSVRGIHSVTLTAASEITASFLTEVLGFETLADDGQRTRLAIGRNGSRAFLDLLKGPAPAHPREAVASFHHVAWRTQDAEQQRLWWQWIGSLGVPVSHPIDRFWFRSIYFREPGGTLFEIATDGPGFTVDEGPDDLGAALVLPPWLERRRLEIERTLHPITLLPPAGEAEADLKLRQRAVQR